MKKKVLLIGLCLCIIILGFVIYKHNCNDLKVVKHLNYKDVNKSEQIKKTINIENIQVKEGTLNEIILNTGIIDASMEVLGVKDKKNFYGYEISGQLCSYNTDSKQTKLFKKAIGKNKYIQNVNFTDKWIVWVEGTDKEKKDESTGTNWAIYAQNINTKKIFEIDKDIYKDICNLPLGMECSPCNISISGDNIVYSTFKREKDKSIKAVIKLVNLANKTMYELDGIKDVNKYYYSSPYIYNENIVWSISKIEKENKNISDVILYNIKDKSKNVISKNSNICSPVINKDLIAANLKFNNSSNIVLYDLHKKDEGWRNYINSTLPIYKNCENISIEGPLFSEDYMIWWDNNMKISYVINTKNNKIYTLDKGESMQVRGLYNKIIFWKEFKPYKTITKYAILK